MATAAPITSPRQARARVAGRTAHGLDTTEARRDLAAANLAAAIERHLAAAPKLTDEQAETLAAMLRGGDS